MPVERAIDFVRCVEDRRAAIDALRFEERDPPREAFEPPRGFMYFFRHAGEPNFSLPLRFFAIPRPPKETEQTPHGTNLVARFLKSQ